MSEFHSVRINPDTKQAEEGRLKVGNVQQNDAPAPSQHKTGGAPSRIRVSVSPEGDVTTERFNVFQSSAAPDPAADPLDAAQSAHGGRVARADIGPDDKIDVRGDRVPARVLVASGLLQRTERGYEWTAEGRRLAGFNEAGQTQGASPASANTNTAEPPQDKPESDKPEVADPDFRLSESSQGAIQEAGAKVGAATLDALVSSLVSGKEETTEKLLTEVAHSMGSEMQDTRAAVDTIVHDLTEVAHKATAKVRLDARDFDAFTTHIWATSPEKAQAAVMDLTDGRTSKLKALAADFVKSGQAYSFEEVAAAEFNIPGTTARREGHRTIITIPGVGEFPLSELIADGRAKVTRK